MSILVNSRHNTAIITFYLLLLKSGKPEELSLTASIRKLLLIRNSMVKNGQSWRSTAIVP